jgi:hypothetical protein
MEPVTVTLNLDGLHAPGKVRGERHDDRDDHRLRLAYPYP